MTVKVQTESVSSECVCWVRSLKLCDRETVLGVFETLDTGEEADESRRNGERSPA